VYWSARTYSKNSIRVALPAVRDYVALAAERGHPAIAITDRGSLSGVTELYTYTRKSDIKPVPGMDLLVALNKTSTRPLTGYLTVLATTQRGYRNLAGLTRTAHVHNKDGVIDIGDLASAAEDGMLDGLACLTGGPHDGLLDKLLRHGSPEAASNVLAALNGWFGAGAWMDLFPVLGDSSASATQLRIDLADSASIGTVITTGPRYLTPDDAPAWQTLNDINAYTADYVTNTHPLHFTDESEVRKWFSGDAWARATADMELLLSRCDVTIPELDTFTIAVPDVSMPMDPDKDLYERVQAAIHDRLTTGVIKAKNEAAYYARMDEELDVIFKAGFAGYLLFTATVTDWIRANRIVYNIRGSASASLLCWLLNISNIDPLAWDLRFDRFLSSDRAKPPDVDIDVDPERRGEIVDWLSSAFPTLRIATFSTGRVSDTRPLQGSLVVQYKAMLRRGKNASPDTLSDEEEAKLIHLAKYEPYMTVGVGAAGFIVAPDETTIRTIPVLRVASSNTVVSAFDKKEAEALGYVKLDVLGVKTLTALRLVRDATGIDFDDVDYTETDVYTSMSKGNTGGLFQVEGRSSTIGMKRLKPKKFSELVAAMALFRPALMDNGETDMYLERRTRKQPIPKRHPIIERHVSETYGVVLYQEQAISIMRDLGLTSEEIEDVRQAIKASNSAVAAASARMKQLMDSINQRGIAHGMSVDDLAWLAHVMQAYANYGFNKAHAVSYAQVSYLTGWYKIHYPLQFWASFLTVYTGDAHEKSYLKEIRDSGITVRGAHVNKSGLHYAVDPDGKSLRKSLTSIKGVGHGAAEEIVRHAPFISLHDLATKVNPRKVTGAKALLEGHSPAACGGVIAALNTGGALTDIPGKENP
jgi:DNA polymerase III alpha subunit